MSTAYPDDEKAAPPAPRSSLWIKLLFLATVVFFVGQYGLKKYRAEPYPTLLMPGGSRQYTEDPEGLVYRVDELFAYGPDGQLAPFALGDAFPLLPNQYWDRVTAADFGLRRVGPHRDPVRLGPVSLPRPSGVTTEAEAEETRLVVRDRVRSLVGFSPDSVLAQRSRYRTRFDTGETERLSTDGVRVISLLPRSYSQTSS